MSTHITNNHPEEKREECGVIAIYSKKGKDVAPLLYRALMALQHRGQDAAGFATYNGKEIISRKGLGLVEQIFTDADLEVKGHFGIGHTRYPTIGQCRGCDVQPTVYKDIATAHNGHVANYNEIKKQLESEGHSFESTVDSEPMVYIIHDNPDREKGVRRIMKEFEGSYSDVVIADGKLFVFRDPHAIRPLVWGENEEYLVFASETVAFEQFGVPYKGEVSGGELIEYDGKKMVRKQLMPEKRRHCMFEYVYFSRPDSIINGKSVYEVRKNLGRILAREAPVSGEAVVISVPDTSRLAASAYAAELELPFEEGLMKNRYIGRTFIMPSQQKRIDAVKLKISPVRQVINGKRVVLIDDSIVRGTTLREIIRILKEAGATEVHLRITCPPVKAPCFYGVDMQTYSELIANKKTVKETGEYLGANSLAYLSLGGLQEAIGLPLCTACLTEEYHTPFVKNMAAQIKAKEMDTGENTHGRS